MDQCSDLIDSGDGLWIAGMELGRAVVFEEDGEEFRRDMLEEGLFHLLWRVSLRCEERGGELVVGGDADLVDGGERHLRDAAA